MPCPLNVVAPLAPITYGVATVPAWNSVLPDSETLSASCWLDTCEASTSATRPAQPDFEVFWPRRLCHWSCWSLCEKSCGGSGTDFAWYCALLVGAISGPTLAITAQRADSNRLATPPIEGCMPYSTPSPFSALTGSNWSCAMARFCRERA